MDKGKVRQDLLSSTEINLAALAERNAITPFCLPLLDDEGIEVASQLFAAVGDLDLDDLTPEFLGDLAVWHAIYAVSTACKKWTKKWDDIIDEAEDLISEGARRVVDFIKKKMKEAGFPDWATEAVGKALAIILKATGEAKLKKALKLARLAGKLGILIRCKLMPF